MKLFALLALLLWVAPAVGEHDPNPPRVQQDASIVKLRQVAKGVRGLKRAKFQPCGPVFPDLTKDPKNPVSLATVWIDPAGGKMAPGHSGDPGVTCEMAAFDRSGNFAGVVETKIKGGQKEDDFTLIPGHLVGLSPLKTYALHKPKDPKEAPILLLAPCGFQTNVDISGGYRLALRKGEVTNAFSNPVKKETDKLSQLSKSTGTDDGTWPT